MGTNRSKTAVRLAAEHRMRESQHLKAKVDRLADVDRMEGCLVHGLHGKLIDEMAGEEDTELAYTDDEGSRTAKDSSLVKLRVLLVNLKALMRQSSTSCGGGAG